MLRENKGFTLIEMVVVTSVIIIISTAGLAIFSEQRNRVDLVLSAQKVANDLRKARNLVMISSKYNMGSGLEIPCGYGIHFDATGDGKTYILFAGNNSDTGNCGTTDKSYNPAPALENDIEVESINLPSNVIISNSANFDVFFEPPYPATTIAPADPLVITLRVKGRDCPDYCKNVIITSSGKIEY